MRVLKYTIVALVLAVGIVGFGHPTVKKMLTDKEIIILNAVYKFVSQYHFKPQELDPANSEKIYKIYLERLDGAKRFFTQEDIAVLDFYKDRIADQMRTNSLDFFELSINLLERAIEKPKSYYTTILSKPFDWSKDEYFETEFDKRSYPEDDAALRDFWRQMLKYETLSRMYSKWNEQQAEDFEGEKMPLDTLEAEARKAVSERYDLYFDRLGKIRRADRFGAYVNAITNIFDPHTDYYSPKAKEDFNINMSGRLEGIGARLTLEKNMTKVSSIVPGGPAWKQGDLKVDDFITAVKQEDEQEAVDVVGWRLDDVVQLIRGAKGTKVTLTVKGVDSQLRQVTITRDEVILDEGNAKSVLIDQPDQAGVFGYIYLPRFYADFERKDGRSCARDVKRELEKLKAEGVDGIVLDLRNNGGGSLRDVVDMAGHFIEKGPIVQVKARKGGARILRDVNEEVVYDGPLVVMVNGYSASASEILAAALQDYNRAIIVGSNTFGKGTVQRFFDLDRIVSQNSEYKPLGEVKLTTQKFYRINGGSTQLKGVQPDIQIPDNFAYLKTGEKRYDYPMAWSQIEPIKYHQSVYQIKGRSDIIKQSTERINAHEGFELIKEYAAYLKKQEDRSLLPINFEKYKALSREIEAQGAKYDDIMSEEISGMNIRNLASDLEMMLSDESKKARNDDWINNLKKDIYLEESLCILKDMIKYHALSEVAPKK